MIDLIVFSKNRAMQLDCLLRSLDEYTDPIFRKKVIYTFTTSDKRFERGYELLKKLHPNVQFIKEENLKANILSNMNSYLTCMMVDDQIMFKQCPHIPMLKENQCFSLRLGGNISEPHISYPMSIDGHVFRTEDIKPLIESISFNNPNILEKKLQRFKKGWDILWKEQVMVSIPCNRVSDKSHCAYTGEYTEHTLTEFFLRGSEIDYHKMNFKNLNNVHADIRYAFRLRETN